MPIKLNANIREYLRQVGVGRNRDIAEITNTSGAQTGATLSIMQKQGFVEKIDWGMWRLTEKGQNTPTIIKDEICELCSDKPASHVHMFLTSDPLTQRFVCKDCKITLQGGQTNSTPQCDQCMEWLENGWY